MASTATDKNGSELAVGTAAVPRIGIDRTDAIHYYDERAERVIVIAADGSLERVTELAGRSIETWADFVDDRRGWKRCYLREGAWEALAREIEEALR